MSQVNRAQFISRAAKGGFALVAGGSLLASATGSSLADVGSFTAGSPALHSGDLTDTDIAKLAATAELLAINFYGRAINSRRFHDRDEIGYLGRARRAELAHYDALAGLLGPDAPRHLKFKYPKGSFMSRQAIAHLGVALETAFVGAYLGAVTALSSNELKGVAASIATAESQHLSVFSDIAFGRPIGRAFPKALTAAQATAAVTPFLA